MPVASTRGTCATAWGHGRHKVGVTFPEGPEVTRFLSISHMDTFTVFGFRRLQGLVPKSCKSKLISRNTQVPKPAQTNTPVANGVGKGGRRGREICPEPLTLTTCLLASSAGQQGLSICGIILSSIVSGGCLVCVDLVADAVLRWQVAPSRWVHSRVTWGVTWVHLCKK